MNWYTVQIKDNTGRRYDAFLQGDDTLQVIAETRYSFAALHGLSVSITARKALYKEWNHGNRTIKGELI